MTTAPAGYPSHSSGTTTNASARVVEDRIDAPPTASGSSFPSTNTTRSLVNTSRGPLIDQVALADALRRGVIFAAGLDVTEPEPLPPDHELYTLPNCVIAPGSCGS